MSITTPYRLPSTSTQALVYLIMRPAACHWAVGWTRTAERHGPSPGLRAAATWRRRTAPFRGSQPRTGQHFQARNPARSRLESPRDQGRGRKAPG